MRSGNVARNILPRRTKLFAPWNVFSALILLPEEQSLGMVKRVLEGFGINVHAAYSVAEAEQVLRSTRLDLAICDFEFLMPASSPCCSLPHAGGSFRRPDAVGTAGPIQLQAHPTARAQAGQRGHAGAEPQGVIHQHGAAAHRHLSPHHAGQAGCRHAELSWPSSTLHQVGVLNLSQTGLCLSAAEPLPHGASLTMSLVLPEGSSSVHASGNVVWSHTSGRTGVAFERSACPEMKRLQERLNTWLPRELGMVARYS